MPEEVEETTEQTPAEDNSAIKQMREALARKDEENAGMRTQLMNGHLTAIGLSADTGLGKAIAKGYEGDVSKDAVAEYAKSEYSYEQEVQENQQAAQMQETQQRADAFGSAAGSIQPSSQEDVIAALDQKLLSPDATRKDASAAIEAKVQHYISQRT